MYFQRVFSSQNKNKILLELNIDGGERVDQSEKPLKKRVTFDESR